MVTAVGWFRIGIIIIPPPIIIIIIIMPIMSNGMRRPNSESPRGRRNNFSKNGRNSAGPIPTRSKGNIQSKIS